MRRLSLKFPYTGQQTNPLDYGLLLLGLVFFSCYRFAFKIDHGRNFVLETRADRFENAQQQKRAPKNIKLTDQPRITARTQTSPRNNEAAQFTLESIV